MAQAYNIDTMTFEDKRKKNRIKEQSYKLSLYKSLKLGPKTILQFLFCKTIFILLIVELFKLSFIVGQMSGVIPLIVCLISFGSGLVFCIMFLFFELFYICTFFKELFNIVKLPLMKMSVKQAKALSKTMKNFEIGGINISKHEYSRDDYFGVSDFYGYILKKKVGFKPNFLGFLYMYCNDVTTDFIEFITKPIAGKVFVDKEYQEKFKRSKVDNSKQAIAVLTKEVNKLQEKTNQYMEQAMEELEKAGRI